MKNKIFKTSLIFMILFLSRSSCYSWPTNNGPQHVVGNFGVYEHNPLDPGGEYHDGIDIPGTGGETRCIAVANLKVVEPRYARWDNSFQGVIFQNRDNPTQYIIYHHVQEIPGGKDLDHQILIEDPPGSDNWVWEYDTQVSKGEEFAIIRTAATAHTTFDHTHFLVCSDYKGNNFHTTAINPLTTGLVGVVDPGDNLPSIFPFFLKRGKDYLHHAVNPYLWGGINVLAEITDNMGASILNLGKQKTDFNF